MSGATAPVGFSRVVSGGGSRLPETEGLDGRLRVVVDAPAPWINSNQRLHRMVTVKLTAAWREAGRAAASGEPYTGPVHITAHIYKPRRGRYDPNNLWPTIKAVVDGFVDAGLLADDDHHHVIGPDMRHGGIGPARIILEIVPANTGQTWSDRVE